ncbi:hypothetical protein GWI33_019293, partial [Rhynchophorus ferrugineus]
STPVSGAQSTVFPLPGTFPWAHSGRGKPRRGMMRRAVFSDLQRKGLERRFQIQKYISKPDRKKLAEKLGLKDSQREKEAAVAQLNRSGGEKSRAVLFHGADGPEYVIRCAICHYLERIVD